MDFALTKEQELIQKSAREFAEKEIRPLDAQIEEEDKIPMSLIEKAAKIGLLGIPVERKYGGGGRTYLDLSLAVEQIARVNGAVAFFVAVNYLPIISIELFGSEEQKQKYLPDLVQGKCVGSFSFTEHSTGSDPRDIQSRAKLDGDHYVCNGRKGFCTNAEYDGTIVIYLRTGDGPFDVSAFVAEKNTEGYTAPPPWPLTGLRGMRVTDIELKDYRIPKENLLGNEGDGYKNLLGTIAIGKLDVANAMLGIAQDALEQSIRYAKEKTMRGKPIGDFQMIQFLIAEMASKIEAARWMLRQAMSLIDQGKQTLQSAAMAKLFVAQMADDVCQKAMQIHGGYGYTKEFKVERLYRDAKFGGVVEGSNEVQRVIIARDILK
jgi:butyryl-CoA dehydrogenase